MWAYKRGHPIAIGIKLESFGSVRLYCLLLCFLAAAYAILFYSFFLLLSFYFPHFNTGVLHRGVRYLYDRLKGVLHQAKSIWRAKNSVT